MDGDVSQAEAVDKRLRSSNQQAASLEMASDSVWLQPKVSIAKKQCTS